MDKYKEAMSQVDYFTEKAEKVIDREALNYIDRLGEQVRDLEKEAKLKNYDRVDEIAYELKSAAGTMGWPLVSEAAGFLRNILEEREKFSDPEQAIKIHVETLSLLFAKELKGQQAVGVHLVSELRKILDKFGIVPGI